MRSTKSRPYRMNRRAEQVDETRERITEAAVRLHTTVGPANTSIAAVAEEAGRHPPDGLPPLRRPRRPVRAPAAATGAPRTRHRTTAPGGRSRASKHAPGRAFSEMYAWYGEHGRGALPDLPRRPEHASRRPRTPCGRSPRPGRMPCSTTSRCRPGRGDRSARSRGTCSVCGRGDRLSCSRVYRARKPLRWQSACSARPLRPTARDRAAADRRSLLAGPSCAREIGPFGTVDNVPRWANSYLHGMCFKLIAVYGSGEPRCAATFPVLRCSPASPLP